MATRDELEELFEEHDIDFTQPGFYDSRAFQRVERNDPSFLENYAEFVHVREYDPEYLERARRIIQDLANFMSAEVAADGRQGACVDASGALMRMLERQNIWSCMVGGAAIVSFPPETRLNTRYFWPFMHPDNPAGTGHMWLHAPPFKVVDVTLAFQGWNQRQAPFIPQTIAIENFEPAEAEIGDLVENELVELFFNDHRRPPTLLDIAPAQLDVMEKFDPFTVREGQTRIKYVPTKVSAMDGTLEQMRNLRLRGRLPAELYQRFLQRQEGEPAARENN